MSILQQLLNLGLVDIGADDSRFEKIKEASLSFAEHLAANPGEIIPAALIAIDYDVNESDPIFSLVEEKVIEHWNTMRNTHTNRPRELLRSIIIHALSIIAENKPVTAALIWQTVISPINHNQTRLGKEVNHLHSLVKKLGKEAETEAIAQIQNIGITHSKQRRKKSLGTDGKIKINPYKKLDSKEILTDVARSVGPQNKLGEPLTTPNPHWTNQPPNWSHEFSPRMADALTKTVNLGMQRLSASFNETLQAFANEIIQSLAAHVKNTETIRGEMTTAQQAQQIRIEVLWWAEAKYSPSLMQGYRKLPGAIAAIAMAHDLSQVVPALAPGSVSYVLHEAVATLFHCDNNSSSQPIGKLLRDVQANGSVLRSLTPNITSSKGRIPLFNLIAESIYGANIKDSELQEKTGIDPEMEITLPGFAMWAFRDIQARRLVEEIT